MRLLLATILFTGSTVDFPTKLAKQHWEGQGKGVFIAKGDRSRVQKVELLKTNDILGLFMGSKVYQVQVYNPMSQVSGPPSVLMIMIIDNQTKKPTYIDTPEKILKVLNQNTPAINSLQQALSVVRAYADLNHYKIVEAPPNPPSELTLLGDKFTKNDWKLDFGATPNSWVIRATLMTHPKFKTHFRGEFTVSKEGQLSVKPIKSTYIGVH